MVCEVETGDGESAVEGRTRTVADYYSIWRRLGRAAIGLVREHTIEMLL